MNLAYSTNAFKRHTLEEALDQIASIGYRGAEIMADVPHAYPPDMPPDRIHRIRDQLARLGLTISNVNAFTLFAAGDTYHPTWIEADLRLVAQRIEHTCNVIRMAAELGAETVSLEPGGMLGPFSTPSREVALRRYQAALEECLPLAEKEGVTLLVEPEPGLVIQRSTECLAFLQQVGHPNLRMNADLGHLFCVGENPAEVLRSARDSIAHIHLDDIAENHIHQHGIPGDGAMNWPEIFTALKQINYQGWLTVELYPYETTPRAAGERAYQFLTTL